MLLFCVKNTITNLTATILHFNTFIYSTHSRRQTFSRPQKFKIATQKLLHVLCAVRAIMTFPALAAYFWNSTRSSVSTKFIFRSRFVGASTAASMAMAMLMPQAQTQYPAKLMVADDSASHLASICLHNKKVSIKLVLPI